MGAVQDSLKNYVSGGYLAEKPLPLLKAINAREGERLAWLVSWLDHLQNAAATDVWAIHDVLIKTNWKYLAQQRLSLVEALNALDKRRNEYQRLTGLAGWLDHLQNAAATDGYLRMTKVQTADWEDVCSTPTDGDYTERLPVPGGWLYRTTSIVREEGSAVPAIALALAFVPDPRGEHGDDEESGTG